MNNDTTQPREQAAERIDYQEKALGYLSDILDAKEAMSAAGVAQAGFATMFREFAVRIAWQAAPEAPTLPIYQVQFYTEQGSSAWHDASESAYHVTMPERRRIVYASTRATPEALGSDTAEFLTTLQGAATEATDEWIAGFVRQHFGIYAATTATCGNSHQSPYEDAPAPSSGGVGSLIVDAATTASVRGRELYEDSCAGRPGVEHPAWDDLSDTGRSYWNEKAATTATTASADKGEKA